MSRPAEMARQLNCLFIENSTSAAGQKGSQVDDRVTSKRAGLHFGAAGGFLRGMEAQLVVTIEHARARSLVFSPDTHTCEACSGRFTVIYAF